MQCLSYGLLRTICPFCVVQSNQNTLKRISCGLKPLCFCRNVYSCPIGVFPFYMLVETSGSNGEHDEEKLNSFLFTSMETGRVADGTVTNEVTKSRVRWGRTHHLFQMHPYISSHPYKHVRRIFGTFVNRLPRLC